MNNYRDFVLEAAKKLNYQVEELSPNDGNLLRRQLIEKFVKGEPSSIFWDSYFPESYYCENKNVWLWLDDLLAYGDAVIFFNENSETGFYKFKKEYSLSEFIGEYGYSEYYITNEKLDYLVCCTDFHTHRACGVAYQWLEARDLAEHSKVK